MYKWDIEVQLYGGGRKWISVETKTEDWYEVEKYCLAQSGVWDLGEHFTLRRPDGTFDCI